MYLTRRGWILVFTTFILSFLLACTYLYWDENLVLGTLEAAFNDMNGDVAGAGASVSNL